MLGGHQHLATWCGPSSTQRQTRKLKMGPSPTTKTRLLSFDRTQSRVVIGLLNRHNTLRRRHAYLGSFFLDPEDIKSLSMEAIWNVGKIRGLP